MCGASESSSPRRGRGEANLSDSKSMKPAQASHEGERVLILQSADPRYLLKALDQLKEKPLFHNPCYALFCRNQPEVVRSFLGHPMLSMIWTHSETRNSWRHLRDLRRQKFDALVLFMTGDPSYRKVKLFPFLLGVPLRHTLIFNEGLDCFFFNLDQWRTLVSYRIRERLHSPVGGHYETNGLMPLMLKLAILPFRFLWLLLVWLRLRLAGLKSSRKGHEDELRLPLSFGP